MIFLAVLAVATAAALLVFRRDIRGAARWGMATAMVIAGVAHLANPTPFEQHLPGWVPAAALLVFATGLVEIALGSALALAPGRSPSSARRLVGQLTAAYLVAVFPANLYVAVAGVEIDGQPGGAYRWLRLPFQALFVVWALWSTSISRATAAHEVDLPRLRLPWVTGPGNETPNTVVMASRLELRRLRDVPAFLVASLRLRSLFRRSSGAITLSLRAAPLQRTFWTLSQWQDHDALDAYARDAAHGAVVARFRARMAASTFTDWEPAMSGRPVWDEARGRIAAEAHGRPSTSRGVR